jgi:hypothetical protein
MLLEHAQTCFIISSSFDGSFKNSVRGGGGDGLDQRGVDSKGVLHDDGAKEHGEVMYTHASVLVDSVGPPSAEVCRAATSFP